MAMLERAYANRDTAMPSVGIILGGLETLHGDPRFREAR